MLALLAGVASKVKYFFFVVLGLGYMIQYFWMGAAAKDEERAQQDEPDSFLPYDYVLTFDKYDQVCFVLNLTLK